MTSWANVFIFLGLFITQDFWPMCMLMMLFGFFRTPTIPMVEVMEFEGDKVKRARLFFDSALFPAEVKEQMMAETTA